MKKYSVLDEFATLICKNPSRDRERARGVISGDVEMDWGFPARALAL